MRWIRNQRIYHGWWVLLAASGIGALGGGVYWYGFTVFFLPVSTELEMSRAVTSLVFAASQFEGGIYGAAVGWIVDRWGPRPLFLFGGLGMGVGYILLSQVDSALSFALVYLVILALAVNGCVFHPATATVNNWFIRRKGLAMGFLSAAYGLGGAIIVPLLGLGIFHIGWRNTAIVSGVVSLVVMTALASVVRNRPEDMGLRPDGDERSARTVLPTADFSVRQALGTASIWLLVAAITVRFLVEGGLTLHLVPIMVERGVSQVEAAAMTGLLALMSIPSRLVNGLVSDRIPKRYLLVLSCGLEIAGMLILINATEVWHLYMFVVVFATGLGGGMVGWAMLGEYYGRQSFATLRGLMGLIYTWGSVVGPVFTGWTFDQTGTYRGALVVLVSIMLLAVVFYGLCRRPSLPASSTTAIM